MSFACRQCGKCCRGLLIRDRGILRGLTLLPDELRHFSETHVRPYFGVGKRPYDSRFEVHAYQLILDICIHLEDDKCRVYSDRPATCRQYPFSLEPDIGEEMLLGVDMNCPAAIELVDSSGGLMEFPDRGSAKELYQLKKLAVDNPRRSWFFDLEGERWVRYDRLD